MAKPSSSLSLALAGFLLLLLACTSPGEPNFLENPTLTPTELERAYHESGESLNAARSPNRKWADGSNWLDGVSHLLPTLPIAEGEFIRDNLTCTQAEALLMAAFPLGADIETWHMEPNSDEIGDAWEYNHATLIWGNHPDALEWYQRENFGDTCGNLMR